MREILIRAGSVAIRARLLDTPTADLVWLALPIYGKAQTWGFEVYFTTSIRAGREAGAREIVRSGELAFWTEGDAIAIGFGPTPLSKDGEIRLAAPCNVWALALDDVRLLRTIHAGDQIAVMQADS